jgi:hypothetical protein
VCAERYPEIDRALLSAEFRKAHEIAAGLGLLRLDERHRNPRVVRRLWPT